MRPYRLAGLTILLCMFILTGYAHAQPAEGFNDAVDRARSAGVPEQNITRLLELGVKYRLDPETVANLADILVIARNENAPLDPYLKKVEEGLVKNVPGPRIVSALNGMLDEQRFVLGLLAGKYGHDEYTGEDAAVLAESLRLGLAQEELESFVNRAPKTPVSMLLLAVENLALLKQVGFGRASAEKVMFAGLEKQALSRDWLHLPRAMASARQSGMTENDIVGTVVRVLENNGGLEDVMRELEFTLRDVEHGPAPAGSKPRPRN